MSRLVKNNEAIKCAECGKQLPKGANFCTRCGCRQSMFRAVTGHLDATEYKLGRAIGRLV